jgi:hypothetical protein
MEAGHLSLCFTHFGLFEINEVSDNQEGENLQRYIYHLLSGAR